MVLFLHLQIYFQLFYAIKITVIEPDVLSFCDAVFVELCCAVYSISYEAAFITEPNCTVMELNVTLLIDGEGTVKSVHIMNLNNDCGQKYRA